MYILGISAYYHDSSAALILDGNIVSAAQEERFTRIKGDKQFPNNAIEYCLNEAGIDIEDVDNIIFYENNLNKFQRIIVTCHMNSPKGLKGFLLSISKWLTKDLWIDKEIKKELMLKKNEIIMYDHHMSHAASAFYPSPFKKSAILTIDGVGEWATMTYGIGDDNKIKLIKQMNFPDSIGLLYSAFTYYLGFKINFDEYKVMGLAPYGKPIYKDLIKKNLITIYDDGSIKLNMDYFNYTKGITMTNKKFENLFDKKVRVPESEITQKDMDIAASLQEVLNEIVLKIANHIYENTKCENLVMAGGVALNVATIGYLKRNSLFKKIWIQPASGDAGGSLGCALSYYYDVLGNKRILNKSDSMKGSFLGPNIDSENKEVDNYFNSINAKYKYYSDDQLIDAIVKNLQDGKIIGIAREQMEYGPRALGHRSIIADPRIINMQKTINLKIKYREGFRPFAPMILLEDKKKYFIINDESPYMLSTYYVNEKIRKPINPKVKGLDLLQEEKSTIPAVTHVDYSSRVQTVDKERNLFTYKVLEKWKEKTGCSLLVNTSFNVRGEPIVCNELDAWNCFMNTDMDCVVIGNRFFEKKNQSRIKKLKMKNSYITKRLEKKKNKEEISCYIFGLTFGYLLAIISIFRLLYRPLCILSIVDLIMLLYSIFCILLATINPSFKILKKIRDFNVLVFNYLGNLMLKCILVIVYFIFVVPVGMFMQKKHKDESFNTNFIDYNVFSTVKSGKYRFLKIFKLFANEYFYMIPLIIILLIISISVVLITSNVFAPFIYTLF